MMPSPTVVVVDVKVPEIIARTFPEGVAGIIIAANPCIAKTDVDAGATGAATELPITLGVM
jgi:hypothetical protein